MLYKHSLIDVGGSGGSSRVGTAAVFFIGAVHTVWLIGGCTVVMFAFRQVIVHAPFPLESNPPILQ